MGNKIKRKRIAHTQNTKNKNEVPGTIKNKDMPRCSGRVRSKHPTDGRDLFEKWLLPQTYIKK